MPDKGHEGGQLPESPKSYWKDSVDLPDFPQLKEDLEVDVVIVGGGLTGITTAYLLANEGFKVALLEANKLLNGTTGHTTAKITAQHGLIYDEFIQNIGESKARLYYEASTKALNFIKETVNEQNIDCDFIEQDAYLYATTEKYARKLENEARAYEKLGIDGEMVDSIPFNIDIKKGLVMKKQAQFNPLKYLANLVQGIVDKGGQIFENTTCVNVETGKHPKVLTHNKKSVTGNYVIACSHFPFYEGMGLYSARMHADRSYILAVKTKEDYPGGMYVSADDPVRSLRSVTINGEEMVLVVGESHQTGQGMDTMEHYKALESFSQNVFEVDKILYRWSAQDLVTQDKVPFIGAITSNQPNIMVATGFRKWGMTNGTVAALLFRSRILGRSNDYDKLFAPSRFYVNPSLKNFFVDNADVVSHLIKGKLEVPSKTVEDLSNDEAAVVSIKGHRKGAYKDQEGTMHIVDTTCTHVGCEVGWNNGERTWDCPCHGSRFSYTGEVIEGPAEKPLKKYDYHMIENLTSEESGY
ncbi:FAD-dependent oxidoreductase [Virgibacillus sp. NKC19-16]|uniref:FAD-dependent oxidoreductase n=1 Tax=Virgibacillus salidurans TaxID=2831673 RepID=UPI001F21C345|nr:FAD-dependent oxidoreductase [Virgibacillus sp. NKC19-16]UJL48273.1 FAD-dependent oxidoreductase [Virgibacillus sp. NKC19-16]